MYISVVDDADIVGNLTHAITSPVVLSNFSISWDNTDIQSDFVKTKSLPRDSFVWIKSVSVNEIKTGKSVRSESTPVAVFRDSVIFYLNSHESWYQFCWATFTFDCDSATMSSPNASEGIRNVMENNAKIDKITFNSIRSDLRFW